MKPELIAEPFRFNPLKHHLEYIRMYICERSEEWPFGREEVLKQIRHLGTSVMDIYSGNLGIAEIIHEISAMLPQKFLCDRSDFAAWTGESFSDFRVITLRDTSVWTIKLNRNEKRWIHIFPARSSPFTFRIKANTLRSAVLYLIISGKNYISADELNSARSLTGLTPVKNIYEAEAISGMIGMLRD